MPPNPPTPASVEAVARAISIEQMRLLGLPAPWWKGDGEWNKTDVVLTPFERDRYRAEARAAILAYQTAQPATAAGQDKNSLAQGLRDTARWIQAHDPLATNYLYCLQAADALERQP